VEGSAFSEMKMKFATRLHFSWLVCIMASNSRPINTILSIFDIRHWTLGQFQIFNIRRPSLRNSKGRHTST
jgi:hypothetical protein